MKKTLKLLLIFMSSVIVLLVGGIGGYSLIMNNQTFYIYDLRFVEPVKNAKSYIYTKNPNTQKTMVSAQRYMQSDSENYLEVAVFVSTSNGTSNVKISSSDESVAKIEYRNNRCYVKYLKAGIATITTTLGPVSDSFKLEVFEKIPTGFKVYDLAYYGENYAKRPEYTNSLVCYSDENEALSYEYGYELFDMAGNIDTEFFNNGLLEIDESSYNGDYFEKISIDRNNKKLKIECKKQALPSSINTSIAVKSYHMIDGKKCLNDIFEIKVYIIANDVEFVQIEMSTNPDFSNKSIYLNIDNIKYSDNLSNDELLSYLTCQRIEENLKLANEKSVYNVYITEKTPEIYMKFRLVYTNGTILDLNKSNLGELYNISVDGKTMNSSNNQLNISANGSSFLECEPMGDYFVLKLKTEYLKTLQNNTSIMEFSFLGSLIDLPINVENNLKTFTFQYINMNSINDVKKLYKENEDGTYSFDYWDNRAIYEKVDYDENNNVTRFWV